MKHKIWYTILISVLLLLLGAVAKAADDETTTGLAETRKIVSVPSNERTTERVTASAAMTYTTVITVDSTVDTPGDGMTIDCTSSPCNLRRALVDARSRTPAERPILISFDIPTSDTNYGRDITNTWTIVMEADYTYGLDTSTILEPESRIIIDGDTQPGGRADGPKIIINSEYSLEALKEDNVIRNLAFNGGGGVYLNESSNIGGGNLVESIWLGLHANGQEIVPGDNPDVTLAGSGIIINSSNNVISGCIVTGPHIAVSLQGSNNTIQYNTFGTRGDKTVPTDTLTCTASNVYNPAQWYGGGSIKFLSGSNNQVISNTIAATHVPHSPTETYPPAIETGGADNLFAYNTIGIDGDGNEVGVCGQGFHVVGQNIHVLSNTIVNARFSYWDGDTGDPTEGAIYINDSSPLARQFTVRNNIVRDSTNMVIEYGPSIPESLRLFDPPRIVSITGTLVVGETEVGSDCPNCLVELYLDDLDDGQDALELLKIAVIDNVTGTARFTATLDSPLPANHGIRVAATTQDDYVIGDFLAGTTTALSPAYAPDATFVHDLAPGWNLFSIDVTPPDPAITQVLSSLAGQYDLVLSFDGGPSGGGKTYDPSNPGASDLTTIDVVHGYWIHITAATTQTLTLDYEPVRDDTPIQLYEGWNLVSYLPDRTLAVTEALESISGQYDMVRGFDGEAKTYMPGQPAFSDLTEFEPGYAYWIKISEGIGATTLNYSGADTPVMLSTSAGTGGLAAPDMQKGVALSSFFTPTTEWVDFYGVASLSGFSAPRNANVVAYDPDGVVAGAFTVHTPPYYGFLHVYADDPNTLGDEGIEDGDEVRFTINGRLATPSKSTVWNAGEDAKEVNLEVTMPFVATNEWADFWGTLTIDGAPAPVGTILAAYDPDGVYMGDYILTKAGRYGFLHAYGDDTDTASDEGAERGDDVTFKAFLPLRTTPAVVNPAGETPTWQGRGARTEVNLSGSAPIPGLPTGIRFDGPTIGETNVAYTFTIFVDPVDVTTPITYHIEHTDLATPIEASMDTRAIYLKSRVWTTPGVKVITVTASNDAGNAVGTQTILIADVFDVGTSGGTQTFTDTAGLRTMIDIPSGVLSETTAFTYTPNVSASHPISSSFGFARRSFELDASSHIGGRITITLEYLDQDWVDAGIDDESSLRLYYWNDAVSAWDDVANACTPVPTYAPDTTANILAAPVCHLSEFAMLGGSGGDGHTVYLPLVTRNQ